MTRRVAVLTVALVIFVAGSASGSEPNQTFETAVVLGPGVLSITDDLYPSTSHPDTYLGVYGLLGSIDYVDDNSSPLGDGFASALYGIEISSGVIHFLVTGCCDDFQGFHGESGEFEVFVDIFDVFGEHVSSFNDTRTLYPGSYDTIVYSAGDWIGGSFDVYIDNTVGAVVDGDVDFYRFTGLTPGATFVASTSDVESSFVDTVLGWFADSGELIEWDDDDGEDNYSLIEGIVPSSGTLTFAVTGYPDTEFEGSHIAFGSYALSIEIGATALAGDYNDDGIVDAVDYTVWRNNLGDLTEADINNAGNGTGGVTSADYTWWKQRYGNTSGAGGIASVPVPEPSGVLLGLLGCLLALFGVRRVS